MLAIPRFRGRWKRRAFTPSVEFQYLERRGIAALGLPGVAGLAHFTQLTH